MPTASEKPWTLRPETASWCSFVPLSCHAEPVSAAVEMPRGDVANPLHQGDDRHQRDDDFCHHPVVEALISEAHRQVAQPAGTR